MLFSNNFKKELIDEANYNVTAETFTDKRGTWYSMPNTIQTKDLEDDIIAEANCYDLLNLFGIANEHVCICRIPETSITGFFFNIDKVTENNYKKILDTLVYLNCNIIYNDMTYNAFVNQRIRNDFQDAGIDSPRLSYYIDIFNQLSKEYNNDIGIDEETIDEIRTEILKKLGWTRTEYQDKSSNDFHKLSIKLGLKEKHIFNVFIPDEYDMKDDLRDYLNYFNYLFN